MKCKAFQIACFSNKNATELNENGAKVNENGAKVNENGAKVEISPLRENTDITIWKTKVSLEKIPHLQGILSCLFSFVNFFFASAYHY